MKKCIVISDSFKGSLPSRDICAIACKRIPLFFPACEVRALNMADGGEGTVDCFLASCGGERVLVSGVQNPYGEPIDAAYGLLPDGTAVIEMAAAAGLPLVAGRKNPCVTTTYGVGQLIADALARAEQGQTPLQIKLSQLSKILTWLVLGICVVIFAVQILRAGGLDFNVVLDSFMVAVSLAVAAIPEGLAAVVTVVLSIGVTNMSRRNAIIRRLTAVETLGCAQVICSDKTGTLTQNKMTVVDHYGDDEKLLATAMSLCSDAEEDESGVAVGEPTECALVNYAHGLGLGKPALKEAQPRVGEAPFDSMRKMMSTIHKTAQGIVQYTKGAPDEILKLCTSYLDNGAVKPMTDAKRSEILAANKAMADRALRVLAASERLWDSVPEDCSPANLEHDLTFIGLTGMIDPVRPEVKAAIEECRSAGIRPIMITGDHIDTAMAIARELGILTPETRAITGSQLNDMSDEEFDRQFKDISVYARVQPEHKTRIVNAWRKHGSVTAMTGDGVNDAPSIKSADIGVGMGITGTDVTKNVADMVLADDNFATIVGAVEEGRRIYDNIRKAIQFLLGSNMSEVISIFVATLMGFTILQPVHLLWINLVTDCFPALALGMEKAEPDIMRRKPRDAKAGVFAGGMGFDIAYQGLLVSLLTLASYFVGHYIESGVWEIADSPDGTTMAFVTMSMAEIFHSFNMRSQRGSIFTLHSMNKTLNWAALGSLIATTLVCEVPFIANAFDFTSVELSEYLIALCFAVSVIPIVAAPECGAVFCCPAGMDMIKSAYQGIHPRQRGLLHGDKGAALFPYRRPGGEHNPGGRGAAHNSADAQPPALSAGRGDWRPAHGAWAAPHKAHERGHAAPPPG